MINKSFSYRLLECVPAILTWGTFILIFVLSFWAPFVITNLMIIYVTYWFARTFLMSTHLILGYRAYRRAVSIDWLKKLQSDPSPKWREIWHLFIIANAIEELSIVEDTVQAIADSHYPKDRVIVILANEARYPKIAEVNREGLNKKFKNTFAAFLSTIHPSDVAGEIRGKGANITYSAKQILPQIKKMGLDPKNVLVTTLDSDNRVHPDFMANLSWTFIRTPEPNLKSYQPLPMFFNNIWSVPFSIRLISIGSSFWQMIEATRPYRLRNFSAHAQSLDMLIKTDFWSNQTIVEDGHQYWRSLFATNGKHEVIPIFVPIYQDAVLSPDGNLMTYREQYLQKRRWAWGASDIPYVLSEAWKKRRILPFGAWLQVGRLVEGHLSWATTSITLALVGWFPIILNPDFRNTVLAFNYPLFYQRLLMLAMVGMIVSLIISRLLLPPRPRSTIRENYFIEWLLTPIILPITNIIFSAIPAIESQTRLAMGKYLGYRITEKAVTRQALPTNG